MVALHGVGSLTANRNKTLCPPTGTYLGKSCYSETIRHDQFAYLVARSRLPAGRACRKRLPELWLLTGTYQWYGVPANIQTGLIDSRPKIPAIKVFTVLQIPADMIERVEGHVEAVRLFLSLAIAEQWNIITKEPLRNSGLFAHSIAWLRFV